MPPRSEARCRGRLYTGEITIRYAEAHLLSAGLLAFSFSVLLFVYILNRRFPIHVG